MDDSAKGQQAAGIDGSIDGHAASGLVYEVETEIIYMLAAVGRLPLFRDLSVETLSCEVEEGGHAGTPARVCSIAKIAPRARALLPSAMDLTSQDGQPHLPPQPAPPSLLCLTRLPCLPTAWTRTTRRRAPSPTSPSSRPQMFPPIYP